MLIDVILRYRLNRPFIIVFLWLFIAIIIAVPTAQAQVVPTDADGFTAYIAGRFQAALPKAKIRTSAPLHLVITYTSGIDDAYLDTIYSACLRDKADCASLVDTFIAQMSGFYASPPPAFNQTTLRILVRPGAYANQYRTGLADQGGPAMIPLVGDLWIVAASDQPGTVMITSHRDLTQLGLSAEEAIDIGKQNMIAEMRHHLAKVLSGHHSGIMLLTGDSYEASLVAFPELWSPVAARFGGNLLVAVPASDVVLCTNGTNPALAAEIADAARMVAANAERPFDATIFRWSKGGWQVVSTP